MALPGVEERLSHGSPTWFYRGKRTFASYVAYHHGSDRITLWSAAPPGAKEMLIETAPDKFFNPPYVGVRGWVGVYLDADPDWDEVAGICREFTSLYARTDETHDPALFEAIPTDDRVLPVVEGVLDHGCLISSLSSIAIGPGETPQPIHADDQVMPLERPHVPTVCNTMWALTDFTEANGATRLVPGSHRWADVPEYGTHYETVPAEMPRGSVLVWHGSLWHGGGANDTERRRYGIAMNYCAGWIRQQENQQLGLDLDTVAGFTPRLAELCGFGTYNHLIGHIDKQTPAQRLLGAPGSDSLFDRT